MKKNSELEVGDIIEVPVSHTDRVTSYVITRVTATQYVTTSGLRFNKNLKVLGGRGNRNYDAYGQQPKAIEPVAEPVKAEVKAEPVVAVVTVDVTAATETVVRTASELTAADHVVSFETESQARQVLETANAYKRTAILVQNLEGETYIVGVFKSKKDAIEAQKSVRGVGKVFSIIVQPSGCTNKAVSFYNIVMLAHAINGEKHDKLVTCDHPYWCDGAKGKIYAKIETPESQPVTQEIPESQEVVEIVEKPTMQYGQPSVGKIHLAEINTPRKVELAAFNALISIENAQKIVRLAKSELSEVCKLIEIRKDESFVFAELDCEAVTYAATVDAQWIMHPNGRWKIYFHDERPEGVANDCSQFEFDGWDLNGDEYRIEFGFGDNDENRDERIVWRIYAKDIVWDGKTRDLVCICRHPDALPEDDMGYKRPPVNPHSVSPIAIPWLATENENEEYEYAY